MNSRISLACLLLVLAVPALLAVRAPISQPPANEAPKALPEMENAAAGGDAEAQYQLGLLVRKGKDYSAGLRAAREWFRKAAWQGHPGAQFELGQAYAVGHAVERNLPLALKWLTRAAGQGQAEAWLALGDLYAEGGPGILQDIAHARECYDKANEIGKAEVWFRLGDVFRRGHSGVAADLPRAFDYYLKAAREGHRDAQFWIGHCYQFGTGTPVNLKRAVHWYTAAARQGEQWAAERLGWLYEHGIGVPRDLQQAVTWYKIAEQKGNFCWRHLTRLKDPETLRRKAIEREKESRTPPTTKDVEITLEPEKSEYDLDDLIIIAIRYRNTGKETYSFTEMHTGGFHHIFSVKDERGQVLTNPFTGRGIVLGSFMSSSPFLDPGQTLMRRKTLSQCVHFEKPGTYALGMREWVYTGKGGWPGKQETRRVAEAKPITVTIRPGDPGKRQRDIDRLVEAYREGKGFPDGMTRPAENFPGRLGILRRLVFYNEPKLLSFFLDALERDHGGDFAETALRALPDRTAVLKAFEERFEHPEKHRTVDLLNSYFHLLGLFDFDLSGDPGRSDKGRHAEEISRRCRDKALRLLQGDAHYRYAYLIPGLLGGSDDLFLIDYLSRSKPSRDLVRQCAWAIQKVKLGREHIPFLESLLNVERDWIITDAAILQLVRLDRAKHLARLKDRRDNFSPAVVKLLLEPEEE